MTVFSKFSCSADAVASSTTLVTGDFSLKDSSTGSVKALVEAPSSFLSF
ncbi:hypothetical protein A2U01_0117043, partial [Trifolium medium]|nr:hypothetical protein [Trifolium medium]